LLAATGVLVLFLGLTGLALDRAFRSSTESALQGRLQGQLYGLLGAAELGTGGRLLLPDTPAEPRFGQPGSGLVAQLVDQSGQVTWRSASAVGIELPVAELLAVDQSRFGRAEIAGQQWFVYAYGMAWIDETDSAHRFTLQVLESPLSFHNQLAAFRRNLYGWLSAAAVILLLLQWGILRWGLSPLRRIEREVREIESGDRQQLHEDYPQELNGLAAGLNLLIGNERRHLERYRNSLADLAHSMKTPLAVLRGSAHESADSGQLQELLDEQVQRMTDIVDYQLQRAATAGGQSLGQSVDVEQTTARIVDSLHKVYQARGLDIVLNIAAGARFYGEQGDLMELLGNLLDNACKWANQRITLVVSCLAGDDWRQGMRLVIEDDGPGIEAQRLRDVLQRGSRADDQVPGHGIGLAVVREIVSAYAGQIWIDRSAEGGARITVTIRYRKEQL
jgi:two-component system sensor histidine kinase PhoQ